MRPACARSKLSGSPIRKRTRWKPRLPLLPSPLLASFGRRWPRRFDDALPALPEVFDRNDVVRALGWAPDRAALFRALEALVFQRRITVERFGAGRVKTTYRKT
jgi:hypothetical protein